MLAGNQALSCRLQGGELAAAWLDAQLFWILGVPAVLLPSSQYVSIRTTAGDLGGSTGSPPNLECPLQK